jgi:RNA ligase (TIGR02306 family)
MSSVIVEVAAVEEVTPHTNADRLCLARIKGWQSVIGKKKDGSPQFEKGDKVVYIPPDATVPREMAEKLGIVTYLAERTNMEGERQLVVKRVRLRGEPSYGFLVPPAEADWEVGRDVREHYGIGKFDPPVKITAGDSEPSHPLFQRYTDIENLRNFPTTFHDGEEVVVSEKIHGTNSRIGYVEGALVAGSHGLQRKRPEAAELATNTYWFPADQEGVMSLLDTLKEEYKVVILYGEVYGSKIQKLHYGQRGGLGYAAFDLLLDEHYVGYDEFIELCTRFGVATVPILERGPFSLDLVRQHAGGATTLDDKHIREGVVVRPVKERLDPKIGRLILKYLSDDYLLNDKLTAADTTDL